MNRKSFMKLLEKDYESRKLNKKMEREKNKRNSLPATITTKMLAATNSTLTSGKPQLEQPQKQTDFHYECPNSKCKAPIFYNQYWFDDFHNRYIALSSFTHRPHRCNQREEEKQQGLINGTYISYHQIRSHYTLVDDWLNRSKYHKSQVD